MGRLELNMQNNPVPPEKITQLVATLKEAEEHSLTVAEVIVRM